MNTQRAAVALRNIIVGTLGATDSTGPADSLDGVNTTLLPDGALAYVVSTGGAYRLHKTLTVTTDSSGAVVVPIAGPGVWLFQSGLNDPRVAQAEGTASLAASASFVVVGNTWIGLPSGAGFYDVADPGGQWQLNSSTGVYTYNGPSGAAYVAAATATVASATAADVIELALMTGTNSVIGTTTFQGTAGNTTVDTTTAPLGTQISTRKSQVFAHGDTFFAALRNVTGAHNLSVTHYSLLLTPA